MIDIIWIFKKSVFFLSKVQWTKFAYIFWKWLNLISNPSSASFASFSPFFNSNNPYTFTTQLLLLLLLLSLLYSYNSRAMFVLILTPTIAPDSSLSVWLYRTTHTTNSHSICFWSNPAFHSIISIYLLFFL